MTTPPCTWSMRARICETAIHLCPILNLFRIDPFLGCSWNDETLKAYPYYLICYIYPTTIKRDTVLVYLHLIFSVWSTARSRKKIIQKLYKSQRIPGILLKSPNFQQKSKTSSYWEMQIKINFDKPPILKRLRERVWNLGFYISVRYSS